MRGIPKMGLWLALIGLLLAACSASSPPAPMSTPALAATAAAAAPSPLPGLAVSPASGACRSGPTPSQTEGPYYTAGSPERTNLVEAGTVGTPLLVTGVVLNADCVPLSGARVDFWQADGAGEYDNAGFQLRGHQFTDELGRYQLETVIPGVYPGRSPHIHVKVFANDGREILTTQLYLTGISDQIADAIFDAALLAQDEAPDADGHRHVSFNFVVVE